MIQLSIQEPQIEQYFNYSQEEIINTLKFIVSNNINVFNLNKETIKLSSQQKKELDSRIASFHDNPKIGRTWNEIKQTL